MLGHWQYLTGCRTAKAFCVKQATLTLPSTVNQASQVPTTRIWSYAYCIQALRDMALHGNSLPLGKLAQGLQQLKGAGGHKTWCHYWLDQRAAGSCFPR